MQCQRLTAAAMPAAMPAAIKVRVPRSVPRLRVSRDCKNGSDSQIPLSVPVLGSATSSSAPLGVITT